MNSTNDLSPTGASCACHKQWHLSCEQAAHRTFQELQRAGYDESDAWRAAVTLMTLRHPEEAPAALDARLQKFVAEMPAA